MLYAHWEGWVKAVAKLYLEYINRKSVPMADLNPGLLGAALKTRVDAVATATTSTNPEFAFAKFVIEGGLNRSCTINESQVRTESNLTSLVLQSIISRLNLDFQPYELRATLIDETLVGSRNRIAHGEYLEIDIDRYLELHDLVLEMLNSFTNDILNSATVGAYRRHPISPAGS